MLMAVFDSIVVLFAFFAIGIVALVFIIKIQILPLKRDLYILRLKNNQIVIRRFAAYPLNGWDYKVAGSPEHEKIHCPVDRDKIGTQLERALIGWKYIHIIHYTQGRATCDPQTDDKEQEKIDYMRVGRGIERNTILYTLFGSPTTWAMVAIFAVMSGLMAFFIGVVVSPHLMAATAGKP